MSAVPSGRLAGSFRNQVRSIWPVEGFFAITGVGAGLEIAGGGAGHGRQLDVGLCGRPR